MIDLKNWHQYEFIAGVDEVGRGPLAGPVVAAAVILDPRRPIPGLMDSKALSEKKREQLAPLIKRDAMAWHIARADVDEIDEINILQASLLAMKRAIEGLTLSPQLALIDGNKCPKLECASEAIVKGDSRVACIAAASIIAKVYRDQEMRDMDTRFPGYGLAKHKGYPTKEHLLALSSLGVTEIHRRSFGPVRKILHSAQSLS